MAIYTTTDLLDRVKKKARLNSNAGGYTDQEILDLATQQMNTTLIAKLCHWGASYNVYKEIIPVTGSTTLYRIPGRAVAGKLDHIFYKDTSGNTKRIKRVNHDVIEEYTEKADSDKPTGFFIQGNHIVLLPMMNAQAAGSIGVYYPFLPNKLVTNSEAKQIVSISGNDVTFSSIPADFTTSALYDLISYRSGNELIAYDQAITDIDSGSNTITFSNLSGYTLSVGDWVSIAGTSPVPMVPEITHPVLVDMTVLEIAKARGNQLAVNNVKDTMKEHMANLETLLGGDRVKSQPTVLSGGNKSPLYE